MYSGKLPAGWADDSDTTPFSSEKLKSMLGWKAEWDYKAILAAYPDEEDAPRL